MKRRRFAALFSSRSNRRAGVALLLVLGLIALLGVLTTLVTEQLKLRLIESVRREQRAELKEAALAGLAAKLAQIAEYGVAQGVVFGPGQGWGDFPQDARGYACERGIELQIGVRDESGCLPLNTTDVAGLAKLFRYLEIPEEASLRLAGALADWVDPDDAVRDNGAEKESYPEGAGPANRAINHPDEILRIAGFAEWFVDKDGLPNERFFRLIPLVSVHSENAWPNINGAGPAVLDFLASEVGIDGTQLMQARSERGVFRRPSELVLAGVPESMGGLVSFTSTVLHVKVIASRGDAAGGVDALVRIRYGSLHIESLVEAMEVPDPSEFTVMSSNTSLTGAAAGSSPSAVVSVRKVRRPFLNEISNTHFAPYRWNQLL